MCGALPYLSSMRKSYPIELKIQVIKGGRAKKDWVQFYKVHDVDRLEEIRDFLVSRVKQLMTMLDITIELKSEIEVRSETNYPLSYDWRDPLPEGWFVQPEDKKLKMEVDYA